MFRKKKKKVVEYVPPEKSKEKAVWKIRMDRGKEILTKYDNEGELKDILGKELDFAADKVGWVDYRYASFKSSGEWETATYPKAAEGFARAIIQIAKKFENQKDGLEKTKKIYTELSRFEKISVSYKEVGEALYDKLEDWASYLENPDEYRIWIDDILASFGEGIDIAKKRIGEITEYLEDKYASD